MLEILGEITVKSLAPLVRNHHPYTQASSCRLHMRLQMPAGLWPKGHEQPKCLRRLI